MFRVAAVQVQYTVNQVWKKANITGIQVSSYNTLEKISKGIGTIAIAN